MNNASAMSNRAPKGGTTGMNGLQYAGGTFLPNTTLGKMAARSSNASTRKQQVAPYTWKVAPEGKTHTIYMKFFGFPIALISNDLNLIPAGAVAFFKLDLVELAELCKRYHAGDRWV